MKPNLLTRKTLSMELAERLADEAVKASRAIDRNTVIAVLEGVVDGITYEIGRR